MKSVVKQGDRNLTICTDDIKPECNHDTECPLNSVCSRKNCYCISGFLSPKGVPLLEFQEDCKDIDECENSPCGNNTVCTNTLGTYSCSCEEGYRNVPLNPKTLNCIENEDMAKTKMNERARDRIQEANTDLDSQSKPVILQKVLMIRTLHFCLQSNNIDECSLNTANCTSNSICKNTNGSYNCVCLPGYKDYSNGGNVTCIDINECSLNTASCPNNSVCKNTNGSYNCVCLPGYEDYSNGRNITCKEPASYCDSQEFEACRRQNYRNEQCSIFQRFNHIRQSVCQENHKKPSVKNVTNEISQILFNNSSPKEVNVRRVSRSSHVVMKMVVPTAHREISRRPKKTLPLACSLPNLQINGAVFISYTDLQSSLPNFIQKDKESSKHHISGDIISQVVTGAVTVKDTDNLDPPVSFYLLHIEDFNPSHQLKCVFWDKTGWSSRGCVTKTQNASHTLCNCSHLSTFAVLTLFHEEENIQNSHILTWITRIGLAVSIFCLMLSFLTFVLCRTLKSAHSSVLSALIGCLFLAQLLFLLGIGQTGNRVLCGIIAGGLHFLFLCAFSWMSLESILLFLTVRNLQAMNYLSSRRSHFPLLCAFGFGIPVIIVTITASLRPTQYGPSTICWLSFKIIWSFLGPILVHIVVNTVLLIFTLHLLRVKLSSLNANVSTLKDKRLLVFKSLAQVFILGCTWFLGYFQFGSGAIVMSYLFTIFNSLQGAFIFLVHCLLNRQVRDEYRKLFRRIHPHKSESEALSNSTMPMTMKTSNVHETTEHSCSSKEVYSTFGTELPCSDQVPPPNQLPHAHAGAWNASDSATEA
ncbi:adhesion G -coupled receptor E3-like [Pelobates cultripes]|uniref:Adhesion G -coupled receptor E3-like n=1 Tax=Pelobates cultripes TaxID=61616 RepID=A0AAD1RL27_PELCU|nr:adhesion G -coupled receptor E3-like [Pelobates cultripes]